MAYSQETKLATGLNNRFSFTFSGLGRGYISRDDIHVYINDVEVGKTFEAGTDNVLIVDGPVLAAGTEVLIRRITPKDKPIVDWQDTGLLREDILDTANEQLLYALHEVLDGYGLTDVQVDINMNGNKITGVGVDLNDPNSLITVSGVGTYRDDSIAAAQAAAQSASNAYYEYQNAQTERILTEAQSSLAQQAAGEAQVSATAADDSEAQALAHSNTALQAALDANAKLQELINAGMPVPIGMMAPFPVNRQPSGWAVVMGQTLQRTVYPQAVTFLTGNDTTPSFTLPDLRGEFVRGADLGRGVDAGRAVGSSQGDTIRNITGSFTRSVGNNAGIIDSSTAVSGAFAKGAQRSYAMAGQSQISYDVEFDASRVVPTSSENRPRNVAVVWCIKLVNHPVDVTQADINAVLASLNTMAQAVNPNNGKYATISLVKSPYQEVGVGVSATILTNVNKEGPLNCSSVAGVLGFVVPESGVYNVGVELCVMGIATGYTNAWIYLKRQRDGVLTDIYRTLVGIPDVSVWHLATAYCDTELQAGDAVYAYLRPDSLAVRIYGNTGAFSIKRLR